MQGERFTARPWSFALTVLLLAFGCGPAAHGAGDAGASPDSGPPAGHDSDGDGLDDAWEFAAGDPSLLDWQRPDTDGDGVADADEDLDGDRLTSMQEQALRQLPQPAGQSSPHPLRFDLLVELDAMQGRLAAPAILDAATAAYAALPLANPDGSAGIGLRFFLDETALEATDFSGDFQQRWDFLAAHGPHFTTVAGVPLDRLIHVALVSRRLDQADRAGDTLPHADAIAASGVLIYVDAIAALHPACGRTVEPVLPPITADEALAATLVHELGHTLQLGHDTAAGGGVNYHNVMSVPTNCLEAQQRAHGDGNQDPALGATAAAAAPRFSRAAFDLMDLSAIISVDTPDFDTAGGYEM